MLYMYIEIQPFSVMIRSKLAGLMTSDQVPMTEGGRLMATESWLVTKPHQVIVPQSGEWKLIYLKLRQVTRLSRYVTEMLPNLYVLCNDMYSVTVKYSNYRILSPNRVKVTTATRLMTYVQVHT